jgi:hypothetical protein
VSAVTLDVALVLDTQQSLSGSVVLLLGTCFAAEQALDLLRWDSFTIEQEGVQSVELLLPVGEGVSVLLLGLLVRHVSSLAVWIRTASEAGVRDRGGLSLVCD